MSNLTTGEKFFPDTEEDLWELRTENTAFYGATALVLFEYCITVADEWRHIWQPKKSLVFWLFILLRYSTLFSNIFFCFTNFIHFQSTMPCKVVFLVFAILAIASDFCIHGIFALRSFAIWNRSWVVLLVLGLLTSAKMMTHVIAVDGPVVVTSGFIRSVMTCGEGSPNWWRAANFETANNTVKSSVESRRQNIKRGYSLYVLRDGILYFALSEVLIIPGVVLNRIPSVNVFNFLFEAFEPVLVSVITQRLVLNLRRVSDKELRPLDMLTMEESMQFASGSIIGNVGAPLRVHATDSNDEVDGTAVVAKVDKGSAIEDPNAICDVQVREIQEVECGGHGSSPPGSHCL